MRSSRLISGIEVQFPFETPYPAQIMVASKVLNALQKRQNALVESPTGTGKSLALLCSVLAYQKSLEQNSDDGFTDRKIPTVYYMSRTHSQLTQIVKELSRTAYRPKMTILGSREQLCVRKRSGVSADENCHTLLNDGACEHYYNTYRLRSTLERSEVFDIEDLVKSGTSLKACPYFTTRSLVRPPGQAKLIFCPYNYVVDIAVRRSLGLDLKNAILIFDEAHNIENVAREAASSTFQIPYLEAALNSLHDVEDSANLRSALHGLIQYISHCCDSMTTISFEHDAHVESGQRMLDILSEFGLGSESLQSLRSSIQTLTARYREDTEGNDDKEEGDNMTSNLSRHRNVSFNDVDLNRVMAALRLCETLCSTLELLYQDGATQHYRLALTRKPSDLASSWEYSLSFWCLSPSVAIGGIARVAASIIVASGTLFPLGSFAAELGVTFDQKIEAPHVISSDQVWVGVIPDVSNRHLTSTYNFVNSLDFQDQLGLTLIGLACRIPSGMLVFLPSYSLLDRLIIRWKQTKRFAELNRVKTVVIEDRKSGAEFDTSVKKYRRLCGSKKGAIFFGVYRGKLSEGIDFANQDARAVICVGIPYPNTREAQVTLKQAHNTAMLRAEPNNPIPSGREWYSQQAYRALNQSLGRCIRHSRDYGAIIFIDSRFQQSEVMSNISKWVRKEVVTFQTFNEAASKLEDFFAKMAERYPISAEPEWKQLHSKFRIQTGAMDAFARNWASNKKTKRILDPARLSVDESMSSSADPRNSGIDISDAGRSVVDNCPGKKKPTPAVGLIDTSDDVSPFPPIESSTANNEVARIRKRPSFYNHPAVSIKNPAAVAPEDPDLIVIDSANDQPFSSNDQAPSEMSNHSPLDKFSFKSSSTALSVSMLPVELIDRNPAVSPSFFKSSAIDLSKPLFSCRKCGMVLWDTLSQYEIRNQARTESEAVFKLVQKSVADLFPMDGYTDLRVIYDFPFPAPHSVKAEHESLYFSVELGLVLRRLACRGCDAKLGGEVIAGNRIDVITSQLGRSWILGAVLKAVRSDLPSVPNSMQGASLIVEDDDITPVTFTPIQEQKDPIALENIAVQTTGSTSPNLFPSRLNRNTECIPKYKSQQFELTLKQPPRLNIFPSLLPYCSSSESSPKPDCEIKPDCAAQSTSNENIYPASLPAAPIEVKRPLPQFIPKSQEPSWLPCKKGKFVK